MSLTNQSFKSLVAVLVICAALTFAITPAQAQSIRPAPVIAESNGNDDIAILDPDLFSTDSETTKHVPAESDPLMQHLISEFGRDSAIIVYESIISNETRGLLTADELRAGRRFLLELYQTYRVNPGDWYGTERYKARYDENGNLIHRLYQSRDPASEWIIEQDDSYTYDAFGNLIERFSTLWFEGQDFSYRYLYEYDLSGRLIEYQSMVELYGVWSNHVRNLFAYDPNDSVVEETCFRGHEDDWVEDNRIQRSYNANGQILSILKQSWQNDLWTDSILTTYTYDSNGLNTHKLVENWIDGQWISQYQEFNTYDMNGNRVHYLKQLWENDQWTTQSETDYLYDASNNMIEQHRYGWYEDEWIVKNLFTYAYDSENRMLEDVHYGWFTDHLSIARRDTYEYDSYGFRSLYARELYDVYGNGFSTFQDSLTNDSLGHLLQKMHISFNYDENFWIYAYKDNFYFYEDGTRSKFEHYHWRDDAWDYSSRILYVYDCGDVTGNGLVDLIDIIALLEYILGQGDLPGTVDIADVNGDGEVNLIDATFLVAYLYQNGLEPLCGFE